MEKNAKRNNTARNDEISSARKTLNNNANTVSVSYGDAHAKSQLRFIKHKKRHKIRNRGKVKKKKEILGTRSEVGRKKKKRKKSKQNDG